MLQQSNELSPIGGSSMCPTTPDQSIQHQNQGKVAEHNRPRHRVLRDHHHLRMPAQSGVTFRFNLDPQQQRGNVSFGPSFKVQARSIMDLTQS